MSDPTGTPQIWYTKWMTDLDTQVVFDYVCRGDLDSRLAYSNAVRYCWPVDDVHVPQYLYFGPMGDSEVKPSCRDAFKIIAATGEIQVNDASAIDFETLSSYTLSVSVTARDLGGQETRRTGRFVVSNSGPAIDWDTPEPGAVLRGVACLVVSV